MLGNSDGLNAEAMLFSAIISTSNFSSRISCGKSCEIGDWLIRSRIIMQSGFQYISSSLESGLYSISLYLSLRLYLDEYCIICDLMIQELIEKDSFRNNELQIREYTGKHLY